MPVIQVVIDEALLESAERVAASARINRSALIRNALREHLRRLEILERERLDRESYRLIPAGKDSEGWEEEAAWPEG